MTPLQRRREAKNQRAQSGRRGYGTEVPIPLPIGGLYSEARNSEMSLTYAGGMENWQSNGVAIETRPAFNYIGTTQDAIALQRIPFEHGAASIYITTYANFARANEAQLPRTFDGRATFSEISGTVILADGIGDPVAFNGTAFSTPAFTTTTGVAQSEFDGILVHHDRPYFWKRYGDLEFYYGDVGAVTGALDRFPLSRLGNIRGSALDMASLTIDAGHGMNDVLAIMTTAGDIVLYEGFDPGDAEDWRQLSRMRIAPPADRLCFAQVGADAWMLTTLGIISIRETLAQGRAALVSEITRPLMDDIRRATAEGGTWQLHASADQSMVIINRIYDGAHQQWIFYVKSRAWATADYPAVNWHNLGTKTEFTATDGRVCRLVSEEGEGETITATLSTGWFRANYNAITEITPTILAKGPLSVRMAVLSDHNETDDDLEEAWQAVTIDPETAATGGATISLSENLGCDANGDVFQVRIEVTATWAQILNITARAV